jgi:hypothetical protein
MNSDSGGSNAASAAPPISTRNPSRSGISSTISAPSAAVSVKSNSGDSASDAYATVPSSPTCVDAPTPSYGLESVTPSIAPTSANIASIADRTEGSFTPASDPNTIEPLCPLPNPAKCSSSASNPSRLSDSGISNAPSNAAPPRAATVPNVATIATTQPATTSQG